MVSRWFSLKDEVIKLRKKGTSIGVINKTYGIPKSTLSVWFKDIKLTTEQRNNIYKNASSKMEMARSKAVLWHNKQKEDRLNKAKLEADIILNDLDLRNNNILELALSFLYLGEGAKKDVTSLGNTNPLILKFFIRSVRRVFPNSKLGKFELHLRSDQDDKEEINYWSKELDIDKNNFTYIKDKRIAKSKTYPDYHGVCVVRFTEVSIQRRLVFLSHKFCNIITELDP